MQRFVTIVLSAGLVVGCIKEDASTGKSDTLAEATSDDTTPDETTVAPDTTPTDPTDAATTATDTATTATTATDAATETTDPCGDGACAGGETKLTCAKDCYCANGTCDQGETRTNCPDDCGCGNGVCDGPENKLTCAADCCGAADCGDCTCDSLCGETITNCPKDCHACGDGIVSQGELECGCKQDACRCIGTDGVLGAGCGDGCCMGYQCDETSGNCPEDCGSGCGNNQCEPGENPFTCPEDCDTAACGDGICQGPGESFENCAVDCATTCGNCDCEPTESYLTCPPDCGICGDGVCSNCPLLDEGDACPADCAP